MKNLVLFFAVMLVIPSYLHSQCMGNLTITDQVTLDKFGCTQWNGGTIEIKGSQILNVKALKSLVNFRGDLIIQDCSSLQSLEGLHNIETIDGNLVIVNNAALGTFGGTTYNLKKVTDRFVVRDCPKLENQGELKGIESIAKGLVITNTGPMDGFGSLVDCPSVELQSTADQEFGGFNNLDGINFLQITKCDNLEAINGFNAASAITGSGSELEISSNSQLKSISGFAKLVQTGKLTIAGNSNLASCCFILPTLLNSAGSVTITGNSSGCNSGNQINAKPTLSNCPSNNSINVSGTSCSVSYMITQPSASDNCDLNTTNARLTLADGSVAFSQSIQGGSSASHSLQVGVNVFRYQASDDAGNQTTCSASITVLDTQKPVLNNCPPANSVNTSVGSCTASYSITQPNPSDNCAIGLTNASLTLADASLAFSQTIQPGATASHTLQVGVNVFRYEAEDLSGNSIVCSASITVIDNGEPVITNCPTDVTVNTDGNVQCSGSHTYTTPTASAACGTISLNEKIISAGGGVTSDVQVNSAQNFTKTFGSGTSTLEYTAASGNGNESTCSYKVTVVDNKKPEFSGVPADVTISCGDPFPNIPTPTAADLCDGNLTNAIIPTSSVSMGGTCMAGAVSEVQDYTWTVTDAAGNSETANWKLTVISDFEFELGSDVSVCGGNSVSLNPGNVGSSYSWSTGASTQSILVSAAGTYSLTVTTANGCCFVDEIIVESGQAPSSSASGGTLSCAAGSIEISGSSTTSGVTYSWTGPGGFTSNAQNPSVSTIGTYTLIVTNATGCTSSAQAVVSADTNVPNVSASGGALSCNVSETSINANSSTSGVSYEWSGPQGFSSTNRNPEVSVPGTYTITVTAANGCSSSADVQVTSDDSGPTVTLQAGTLSCNILTTVIDVTASSDAESYDWTGPSGFSSEEKEPEISEIGTYTVMVLGDNGCSTIEEIEVTGDYGVPNVSAMGGKISCADNEAMISGGSTTPNVVYSWAGPNDFASSVENPFISQPGTYILTVIAQNGCTASAEAIVEGDGEIPSISASGGRIDCVNETVVIKGAVDSSESTTLWTGPNGFSTSNLEAEVDIPGSYIFTVTSAGGCQTFAAVEVVLDNSEPTFTILKGTVDCDDAEAQFVMLTDAVNPIFEWTGPNGFTSNEEQPEYTQAGVYDVKITGANSCVSNGSITIDHDIAYTYDVASVGGNANITIEGGTPPFSIFWNDQVEGPSVNNLNFGENYVRVTDGLNCMQTIFFDITSSTSDLGLMDGVSIYPNPTADYLSLSLSKKLARGTLTIIDQKGAIVYASKFKDQIDVSGLPAGIYFLKLISEEVGYYYKFVKL